MKRFTETSKWSDPWFYILKPELKLLWLYIVDNCDCAGVWQCNLPMASHCLGYAYTSSSLEGLGDRIEFLYGDKYWIPKFCAFQYGELSDFCKQHVNVKKRLLEINRLSRVAPTLDITPVPTGKEKEKEKEKEGLGQGVLVEVESCAAEIYSLYPRKVARPAALKSIQKALKNHKPEFLKEKVAAYAKSINGTEPKFIPHPATWFNQERFNDPILEEVHKPQFGRSLSLGEMRAVLDAKKKEMERLRTAHCSEVAMGEHWNNDAAKKSYFQIKSDCHELNRKIANLI